MEARDHQSLGLPVIEKTAELRKRLIRETERINDFSQILWI
jgi:hypothetical protein